MSQSPFSKTNPVFRLSFHEILEVISQVNPKDYRQNTGTNYEWNSVVENTILLNKLFSENHATPHFPSRKAIHSYTSNIRTAVVNKPSQENVPQTTINPLWNTLVKAAFNQINAPEFFRLGARQQRLPVFYTADELKKIYRQRAKMTHPDQTKGSHFEFIELRKNYQILMDFLKKID